MMIVAFPDTCENNSTRKRDVHHWSHDNAAHHNAHNAPLLVSYSPKGVQEKDRQQGREALQASLLFMHEHMNAEKGGGGKPVTRS
jgi:hypothetical protein